MDDKFIDGVIAGAIAGLIKNTPDLLFHNLLNITGKSFWDYANIIATGRHPHGLIEQIYSFFFEIVFSISVGLIYIFVIPYLRTKYNLLRGAIYGAMVWFAIRAWVTAFHIEPLMQEDQSTMIVNSILSILFGIILEWLLQVLKNKHYEGLS
ncbi:hypothetical protein [Candidatus Formimonas warabiya]|uniref:Uncharacterized protein n=1 Tax=Formimonas warabiya TaxID=1761012 RepID=A0A3G1KTK4_FORW1|nr:hypothetical protein [Candidatus Formimonas warabiya]ATW25789.1 hypothetical protein DCMF_14360 [Candidatus Formimonas warabiya]